MIKDIEALNFTESKKFFEGRVGSREGKYVIYFNFQKSMKIYK